MNIYIKEFENKLSKEFCKELISFYEGMSSEDKNILYWRDEIPSEELVEISTKLENLVLPCVTEYFADFNSLTDAKDLYLDNFLISKHGEDYFDDLHYDTPLYTRGERTGYRPFICMLYLNDKEFSGGQVIFPVQKYILEPKEGKVVLFPSSFQFPHMVSSISGGDRYSIRITFNSTSPKLDLN